MPYRKLIDRLKEKAQTEQDVPLEFQPIETKEGTIDYAAHQIWRQLSTLFCKATPEQLKKGVLIQVGIIFLTSYCYTITDMSYRIYTPPTLCDFDFSDFERDEQYTIFNRVVQLAYVDGVFAQPNRTGWEFSNFDYTT
jgi:hypothetical protein